jgi:hypothetical protein
VNVEIVSSVNARKFLVIIPSNAETSSLSFLTFWDFDIKYIVMNRIFDRIKKLHIFRHGNDIVVIL